MTPPSTAGLDVLAAENQEVAKEDEDTTPPLPENQWTPAPAPPTLAASYLASRSALARTRQRRAMSDSTIPDTSVARESDVGGFKIVITRPEDGQRPRTLEDIETAEPTLLDISIPTWKLGTPRFSIRGTPFIRGSSYAPTEEIRSSNPSLLNRTLRELTPEFSVSPARSHSPMLHIQTRPPTHSLTPRSLMSPRLPPALRSTYISTHLVIEPAMFDSLTFKPACDDRSIVRYAPSTGAVTAASPPRLVAEITSPSFLDYDLLSDFFLTFRSFLEPTDLLRMLFARLRWALAQGDQEIGTVVRVRTFVALRHWILNYFMDDFVVDHELRVTFCDLLNDLMDELPLDFKGRKPWVKILTELKKCWRRVCAQFWDGPDFDASVGPDVPISPGGIAGHRDPSLDPSFWEKMDSSMFQLDGFFVPNHNTNPSTILEETGFSVDVMRPAPVDFVTTGERPRTPENPPAEDVGRGQTSPGSITSVDVISCSFPTKGMRFPQPGNHNYPLAAHPADPNSVGASADLIATTPRALMGKRVRPQHKRNVSLTDSLREHASLATEKDPSKNPEPLFALPYAGSLVRGNFLPPGQPFVEILPPSAAGGPSRQTTVFQPQVAEPQEDKTSASAMSGQGMRRLLGSVRRALSTKGQTVSPTQGNFINISPIGPRGATTNRLPGTAIVPQARPPMNGVRPPVRIDLLGAEIVEDFKKAVREDAAAAGAEQQLAFLASQSVGSDNQEQVDDYPGGYLGNNADFRPLSDMAITTGSKSIVIVDDTVQTDLPLMTGALPAVNSSVEAFAETFMPNGADLTPPNTPPGRPMGTPRRSSYIFGREGARPPVPSDSLPPFIPDMETLGPAASSTPARPSEDTSVRPSFDFSQSPPPNRPPLRGVRGHYRHPSSRSYRSKGSIHHRRYASFTSGTAPQPTIRSFDATTYSEGSIDYDAADGPVPQPLRVLRRRPGGDLRAVTNVGDLEPGTLRRSRSVGSLTTYTDSIRSSYIQSPVGDSSGFVDVVSSDYSRGRVETFSLGAIAEQHPKRNLSLFSTHSSKPVMRPSFEAEAKKLAQIPDDIDDDGGVESALLKLEGKYQKRVTRFSLGPLGAPLTKSDPVPATKHVEEEPATNEEKVEHRLVHVADEQHLVPPAAASPVAMEDGGSLLAPPNAQKINDDTGTFLSADSYGSYCSIPLLERGLTDDGRNKGKASKEWTNLSILQGSDEDTPSPTVHQSPFESQHPSYDFVNRTPSIDKIKPGDTVPTPNSPPRPGTEQSFLNMDSDDDGNSDLSSELSAELPRSNEDDRAFPPLRQGTTVRGLSSHPPNEQPSNHAAPTQTNSELPSPPMTLVQALQMSPPNTAAIPVLHDHQVWGEKPLPPTPDTSPTTAAAPYALNMGSPTDPTGTKEALRYAPKLDIPDSPQHRVEPPRNKFSVHLPFVLAFDSEILAQQFTLIEKDALNEIDWKELIDMRWKNAEHSGINTRSWVSFLRDTDARGVEVVIARFNIMVKWAISEVVLTQDPEERARCIIKFIHIAAHCRRHRNFATTSQLTIALTSNEVCRLAKTWAMLPPSDIATLRDLEALISPTRNFYNLRREMEGGGSIGAASAEMGCIPFVGIYTHDLLFNAQRPSEIASSPTTAPLVNFERCRMASGVVKTLLRLLEASTLYSFQPIEGLTERCLWMGALSDEEIRKRSEALE